MSQLACVDMYAHSPEMSMKPLTVVANLFTFIVSSVQEVLESHPDPQWPQSNVEPKGSGDNIMMCCHNISEKGGLNYIRKGYWCSFDDLYAIGGHLL